MTVLLTVSISSTCFGQLFTHLQERWTVFCSLRYNVPKLSTQSSNILHTDHISRSLHPGYRPTKTLVPYISNCKTQSSAPEDGQIIARNMLSLLKLLIKLSLLHLVGYRYYLEHAEYILMHKRQNVAGSLHKRRYNVRKPVTLRRILVTFIALEKQ